MAILGPTLLELTCHTSTKLERMSYVFTSRAFGYITGSIIGGWFYEKYNGHVVLALSCVWGTLMMMVLPYVTSLLGLVIVTVLLGVGLGSLNTGTYRTMSSHSSYLDVISVLGRIHGVHT